MLMSKEYGSVKRSSQVSKYVHNKQKRVAAQ